MLICKVSIDSDIIHDKRICWYERRNLKLMIIEKKCDLTFKLYIKQCYCIVWSVKKYRNLKPKGCKNKRNPEE